MTKTLELKKIELGFTVTRETERSAVFEWSNGQLTISTGLDKTELVKAVADVLLMLICWEGKEKQAKVRSASIKEEK